MSANFDRIENERLERQIHKDTLNTLYCPCGEEKEPDEEWCPACQETRKREEELEQQDSEPEEF